MVTITIIDNHLIATIRGIHKFFALKNKIVVPIDQVIGATVDSGIMRSQALKGLRVPGTSIPGLYRAGTYYLDDGTTFWAAHDARKVIVIELKDHQYNRLIVQVDDPEVAVRQIEQAIARAHN